MGSGNIYSAKNDDDVMAIKSIVRFQKVIGIPLSGTKRHHPNLEHSAISHLYYTGFVYGTCFIKDWFICLPSRSDSTAAGETIGLDLELLQILIGNQTCL